MPTFYPTSHTMDNDTQAPLAEGIRINKYLATCGYESRRKADQLIADGVVEINGKRVDAPGVRVMPGDYVKVNGKHALPKEEASILLNKPRGIVCSREAQGAEGTVYDLLPAKYRHVNYVGRLDADSEGLLILTNKGELSQRLAHPTGGVEKEYWVTLNQPYENSVLLQLLKGVRIPEGQAKAKFICRLSPRRACVVLEQGLKRQVRQMFACLGFRVRKLVRVRIGSLWGGDLAPGRAMLLTPEQEKLATTNPAPRKGLISAAQAFPANGSISAEQLAKALDEKAARKALEEETDYVFNPADFETEEEADFPHRDWDDEEDFYPAPRQQDRFRESRGKFRSGEGERGGFRSKFRSGEGERGGFRSKFRSGEGERGGFRNKFRSGEGERGGFRSKFRSGEGERGGFRSKFRSGEGERGGFRNKFRSGEGERGGFRSKFRSGEGERGGFRNKFRSGEGERGGFRNKFRSGEGERGGFRNSFSSKSKGGYGSPRRTTGPKRGGKRY